MSDSALSPDKQRNIERGEKKNREDNLYLSLILVIHLLGDHNSNEKHGSQATVLERVLLQ